MTLDDVNRLFSYWRKFPPVRDLIAAFIGFEPQMDSDVAPESKYMTGDDLKRLMAATGGKIPGMG